MGEGMNWLEGIMRTEKGLSIVTSQQFIRGSDMASAGKSCLEREAR